MDTSVMFLTETENQMYTIKGLTCEIAARRAQLLEEAKKSEDRLRDLMESTLSCKEICEVLCITEPTLIKRRKLGDIPYIKLGNNFRYLRPIELINGGKGE